MRLLALVLLAALPAAAQEAVPCQDAYAGSLAGLVEPLEETTRAYANGAVRVLVVAVDEPACCGVFPAVLLPDPEVGFRTCRLLMVNDGQGFGGLRFGPGEAEYDAANGLVVPMTARVSTGGDAYVERPVAIVVNQATSEVSMR